MTHHATGGYAWGQRRAEHFMQLITVCLTALLQAQFTKDFWQMPYR